MGKLSRLLIILFFIPTVHAYVHVWQGQFYTGTTFHNGTFDFNFTVYDAEVNGSLCYSNTTTLLTGDLGEWITEQTGVGDFCDNASQDYWLEIIINGTVQEPRKRLNQWDFIRQDANEIVSANHTFLGNSQMSGNVTSNNWFLGLFNWLVSSGISQRYLLFNGSHLSYNESYLNTTINSLIAESNSTSCAAEGSCDAVTYDSEAALWDQNSSDDFSGNYSDLDFTGSTGLSDGIDNDTTYAAGNGLELNDTTFSVASNSSFTVVSASSYQAEGRIGLTDNSSFHVCNGTFILNECLTPCVLDIQDGLIVGCN